MIEDEKSRPARGGSPILTSQSTGPYGSAAELYWLAGWANPIPVKGKSHPAEGCTGHAGRSVLFTDLAGWVTGPQSAHNVALRMAGTIGIDVDAHDGEVGNITLKNAIQQLGDLPDTWSSTSRGQGQPSRIYFYRVPFPRESAVARREKAFVDAFGKNVEILHRAHRYAVCWPSVHPDTGEIYRWYAPDGTLADRVPQKGELPELPAAWLDFLAPESTPVTAQQTSSNLFMQPSDSLFGGGAGLKSRNTANRDMKALLDKFADPATDGRASSGLAGLAMVAGRGVVAGFWTEQEARDSITSTAYANGYIQRHGLSDLETQLSRGLRDGMADPWQVVPDPSEPTERKSRRMDLRAFLDGTYAPPVPSVGMPRSDGKCLLYPARWHTIIGPNGTGKSFFALACAIDELRKGNTVIYAHFEESDPGGTIMRLRAMAPDITTEMIVERFIWLDCSTRWTPGEWTEDIRDGNPSLVILDGINDATTRQGWDPSEINAPGNYADLFVTPCRVAGAAVLSLGHPPKAKGRETERHGYGSTAWLDKLEGVGFRLLPSKKRIREGHHGYAMLYSVKDRYGQVEKGLEPADGKDMDGWYVVGSFWVDSTTPDRSTYGIKPTELNEEGNKKDTIDLLGEGILTALANTIAQDGAFTSLRNLTAILREAGVKFGSDDLEPAVDRLHRRGALNSPQVAARKPRPGALMVLSSAPHEDLDSELI